MKSRTKLLTGMIAIMLSAVLLFVAVVTINNTSNNVNQVSASSRTIELTETAMDAQSILDEFDDAVLTTEGSTTYFEGYKSLDLNAISEIDYISDIDYEELAECTVKYNFSYNSETNIVTIAAKATLPDGSVEIDEISGVGFINDNDEIDAVMNIDGEGVLLSEMRSAGMIENCGWFSSLIKKIVKSVVVAAVTAVVVAATAAVVVATAGVAATALVAIGAGAAGSAAVVAGGAAVGVAAGALFYSTIGKAAIEAGTAIGEVIGDGAEIIIDKATNAILAFMLECIEYAATKVTEKIENTKSGEYRFIAFVGKVAYMTNMTFDKLHAVWGLRLGLSTYSSPSDAYSAACDASNFGTPRHHGLPTAANIKNYKPGIYFEHYHTHENSVTYNELGYEIKSGHACYGGFVIVN